MPHRHGQSPRTILLRRPAVLSVMEGVFVPASSSPGPGDVLDEIERRWARRCAEIPALYDGRLYHVLGVHRNGHGGAVIHVMDCAYRFHAVQDKDFDLGVRPLGTKGLTIREGRVLMGQRTKSVCSYPGLWEFAPSGVVEVDSTPGCNIAAELREETGLEPVREPTPIALLYDDVLRCWEIVFRVEPGPGGPRPAPSEYEELCWRRPDDLPKDLTPIARQMTTLLPSVVRQDASSVAAPPPKRS